MDFDHEGWKAVTDDIRRRIAEVRAGLQKPTPPQQRVVKQPVVEEPVVIEEPKTKSAAELYKDKLRKKKNG